MITYCTVCRARVHVPSGQPATAYCDQHAPRRKKATTAVRVASRAPRRAAASRAGKLVAIGAAVGAVVIVIVAAARPRPAADAVPLPPVAAPRQVAVAPPAAAPAVAEKPAAPAADPHADARRALEEAKRFAAAHASDPEAIVRYCREHYQEVERTPFEAGFKALLDDAQRRLDVMRASKQIDAALAAAEKVRAEDAEFRKRDEFERALDEAARLAEKFAKERLADVAAARERWRAGWAAAAETIVRGLVSDARKLADDRKWDDALRKLEELPEQFASAPAAAELERVREEIRAKRGAADAEATAKLKRYVGTYTGQVQQMDISVEVELAGSQLRAKLPPPMQGTFPMTPSGEHKFTLGGAATAEFVMSGDKVERLVVEAMGQSITLLPK